MGRAILDAKTVLIFYNGVRCGSMNRLIFGALGGYGIPTPPDATGYINYRRAIATVRRDANGDLFIESTEPLIHGHPPLTRREW
jgi:hypothetical protein